MSMETKVELLQQPLIDPEVAKKIGEAFAEILHRDMQMPSFMRTVVEHQKENPQKSPMQCMRDMVQPYRELQQKVLRIRLDPGIRVLKNPQPAVTVNSN